eukprot:1160531-Pelagomonas_calceolata.AAC.2
MQSLPEIAMQGWVGSIPAQGGLTACKLTDAHAVYFRNGFERIGQICPTGKDKSYVSSSARVDAEFGKVAVSLPSSWITLFNFVQSVVG